MKSCIFLQTYLCSLRLKSYILSSSALRTSFLNVSGLFRCSFANFWHRILWWGHVFLLMYLPWGSYFCCLTVDQCNTTSESAKSSWRSIAVKQAFLATLQVVLLEGFLGLPFFNLTSINLTYYLPFHNCIRSCGNGYLRKLGYLLTALSCFGKKQFLSFHVAMFWNTAKTTDLTKC